MPTVTKVLVAAAVFCQHSYDDLTGWVIFGAVMSFLTAIGIGANDVANAFATSVGSGTITLRQASMIASVAEFGGAVLIGSAVTKTVKKKIIDPEQWAAEPEHLMLGMIATLTACALWLALATKFKLPVSTTHTVVGGLLGFALFTKPEAIRMDKLIPIFISWVTAPVMAGCMASVIFWIVRTLILRHPESLERARKSYWIIVTVVFWAGFTFICIKGPPGWKKIMDDSNMNGEKKEPADRWTAVGFSLASALVIGLIVQYTIAPRIYAKVLAEDVKEMPWHVSDVEMDSAVAPRAKPDENEAVADAEKNEAGEAAVVPAADEAQIDRNERVLVMAKKAERFDDRTEAMMAYLQVVSATFDSFAHGSNDTANAIGPFAALWSLYRHGAVTDDVPFWCLCLAGVGLVIGLALFGEAIIKALGTELVRITPSRGFTIEVGSSTMVIICSANGIPTSTTHCQVGATVGVGLLEGRCDGVNGPMLLKVFFGWVATLIIAGLTSGVLYLFLEAVVC